MRVILSISSYKTHAFLLLLSTYFLHRILFVYCYYYFLGRKLFLGHFSLEVMAFVREDWTLMGIFFCGVYRYDEGNFVLCQRFAVQILMEMVSFNMFYSRLSANN